MGPSETVLLLTRREYRRPPLADERFKLGLNIELSIWVP
jgi:hypothetical protein